MQVNLFVSVKVLLTSLRRRYRADLVFSYLKRSYFNALFACFNIFIKHACKGNVKYFLLGLNNTKAE